MLQESPPTKNAIHASQVANRKQRQENYESKASKSTKNKTAGKQSTRLDNWKVAKYMRKNDIKTYNQLLLAAESRSDDGQDDIATFVFNRSKKHLHELLTKMWQMAEVQDK